MPDRVLSVEDARLILSEYAELTVALESMEEAHIVAVLLDSGQVVFRVLDH